MKRFLFSATILLFTALQAGAQIKPDFFPGKMSQQKAGNFDAIANPASKTSPVPKGWSYPYGYFGGGRFLSRKTLLTLP